MCRSPEREQIDLDLTLGNLSISKAARQLGIDRSSVRRHRRRHLLPKVSEAFKHGDLGEVDILGKLESLCHRMERRLEEVETTDNYPAIVAINRELRGNLELLAKLRPETDATSPLTQAIEQLWAKAEQDYGPVERCPTCGNMSQLLDD